LTKIKAEPFSHGNDGYRFQSNIQADFSTNTWYKGPDRQLLSFLKDEMSCIANYPELHAESLTGQLADKHHLANDQILICNGSAEAIFLIAQAYQGISSRILVPTFSEYEHACQVFGHKVSYSGTGFLSDDMSTPQGLLWMCNPNNPTGQVFSRELLSQLVKHNPQTLFIVDEAYTEFCMDDCSLVSFIGKFKNLLVLKSMTKNYCLPGLRLGYVLGHQSVIQSLSKLRPPWSVNSLALKAGSYALKNSDVSEEELIEYLSLSRSFRMELEQIKGFEVLPSSTGFFLVKTPMEAGELKLRLIEDYGLLVRDASNFRTLSDYHIRLATLTREKNNLLISALKEIFNVG